MTGGGGAMMCKGKFVFTVFASFLILTAFASASAAKMIYVPDDYEKIQWAVDNSSDGDTIIVRDGIYYENVFVNKQLTIKSERGYANCVVNGGGSDVFTLEADGIRIEGFTITGGRHGIFINSNNNTIIINNISSNKQYGIYLAGSNNNIISNNNISSNKWHGILLLYSDNNSISENNISSNKWGDGIYLDYSNNNIVLNNNISLNRYGIYLDYSNNNSISENDISSNNDDGIYLVGNNNIVSNNNISSNNNDGIYLDYSNNNIVLNNNISSNDNSIYLWHSDNNIISNNNISSNKCHGIVLWYSDNNIVLNNNISSNKWHGILLLYSDNNSISENNISSNKWEGMDLYYSNENTIRKNEFINNGIFVEYSYDNIVEDNTVNGKPLVYLEGESDEFIDNAGQVILVKCKNITVMNLELTNTDVGIELWQSDNCLISNNNISSNNRYGILLCDSNNNSVSNNIIRSNKWKGIYLWYSNNNSISNNEFMNDGLFVYDSYGNIVEDNTVNGKPLVYLENESDKIIDDAGQIILVRCSNITVMNAEIKNTDIGIELWQSDNCLISNNNISLNKWEGIDLWYSNNNSISDNIICSNNWHGIFLSESNNNSISENDISSNNDDGIYLDNSNNNSISKNNISSNNDYGINLDHSNNNIIYLNNFIKNKYNIYSSYSSTNIWNSTEPITYTYKGSKFTNYMGNYWDDYTGYDANGDGIGDTPYSIYADEDKYPLIEPFENYFVETPTPAQIFDTGRPENPYPSISGKFIGTIKTNTKIIAKKLYTYACKGTGGHTEHALICNSTWCAEAKWKGYKEDWMNISFNRTVVLMPHETYNITIVTGSYPQIHHTSSLKTENGWINCTEFIDANGNKYEDWIPAIMLWS